MYPISCSFVAAGKKNNNTDGEDNTTSSCGFCLVSGFPPLVDVIGNIHVQEEGGLKDGTSSNNPSNTRPISVTNSPIPNEDGIDDVMKLAFPVVGWFVRSNWKKYGLEKVTLVKGFFLFNFSSNEGVDSIDVDIFRKILDISPKVANQNFTKPPSFDDLREFLRELGYNDRLQPPSFPVKKTQESSRKLKGIEMLFEAALLGIDTHKSIKDSQREFQQSQVKELALRKDKNGDYDEDDDNEEEDDEDESVNEEENTVAETEEEETANSEHEEDDTKGEDQKTEEEPKGDDQAKEAKVGAPDLELKQIDHSAAILESIKSQVPSIVKDSLGSNIGDELQKVLQSHTEGLKKELVVKKVENHENDQDEDPPAGPNQGKESKKRRTRKEAESSKKSSTPKESTKGKPLSKSSKTGKSAPTDQSLKEHEHEVQMDFKEPTFDNVANDVDVPHVDPRPKIPKPDWFTQPPRPETPEPDWNTVKTIDDAPEQPWFNEMINAEKPPLTFDELMSKTIDFSAYAMNRLKLTKLTREVLVGPVFNLLKGTCKSCVELEYNMEECFRALID
ncbi:hypothetical protein Tco_0898118 [Tanacetum coccineum]